MFGSNSWADGIYIALSLVIAAGVDDSIPDKMGLRFVFVFCIIFGFVIAGLFMSVVEMAIDTTLLSFCKDCKLHGGKPRYAPPLLESVLGKFETKAEKEANKNKA